MASWWFFSEALINFQIKGSLYRAQGRIIPDWKVLEVDYDQGICSMAWIIVSKFQDFSLPILKPSGVTTSIYVDLSYNYFLVTWNALITDRP